MWVVVVGEDAAGVTLAGDVVDPAHLVERIVEAVIAEAAIRVVSFSPEKRCSRADLVLLDDDERSVIRDAESGGGGELGSGLGDGRHDPSAVVVPHRSLEQGLLLVGREVAALGLQLGDHGVVDAIVDEQVAVGRASGSVVGGLRHPGVLGGFGDIGGFVDHHRRVASADTEGRLARAVGGS